MNSGKKVFTIIAILLSILIILVTSYAARKRQEVRKEASSPSGVASIFLSPETATKNLNEKFPVQILFNTTGVTISTVALRITYPFTGNTPQVEASNIRVNPDLLGTGDWSCPVRQIITEADYVRVDIACANTTTTGFVSSQNTLFATFDLEGKALPSGENITLSFDPAQTSISQKADPGTDILRTPTSTGVYTFLAGDITPSPELTTSPTQEVTPSVEPTVSPEVTPSISPEVTPSPEVTLTPSPEATPTQGEDKGSLRVSVKARDVVGGNGTGKVKNFRIILSQGGTERMCFATTPFTGLANGVFEGTIANINPGTYDVLVKGWSHLQRKGTVTINVGDNTLDLTGRLLLAGDFFGESSVTCNPTLGDNLLDIGDVSDLIAQYTDISMPATGAKERYDVNLDTIVDIEDIVAVISNFSDANSVSVEGEN